MIAAILLLIMPMTVLWASFFMDEIPEPSMMDYLAFGAFLYFSVVLFKRGKLIRRRSKGTENVELEGSVEIKVDIGEKEFIRFNFSLVYSNPFILLLTVASAIGVYHAVSQGLVSITNNPLTLIFGSLTLVVFPWTLFHQSGKQYRNNSQLHDLVTYTFDEEKITVAGKSFSKEFNWSKVLRIKTTKKWIIIFTSKRDGLFIPIRCLQTEKEKQFLEAVRVIAE